VGIRLRNARKVKGLSLRKLAKELDVHFTLLAHIERGVRFPPKDRLAKFASFLSLTAHQLEALIAVIRPGLNPYLLLPEISPPDLSHEWIEKEAEKTLENYRKSTNQAEVDLPVPIEAVLNRAWKLTVKTFDFDREKTIASRNKGLLYGGLYPDGFRGKDRVVVVNSGRIRGKELSIPERHVTIAHEAGHFALHCENKRSKQMFFSFTQGPTFCREAECELTPLNSLEYQASAFGACLLMPREVFRFEWVRLEGSIAKLANAFGVTEEFVQLRSAMMNL
jgi:transcriptional regulator with XRE-family HTH domain